MNAREKAEAKARDIVIPWENFNINAWEADMGSLARGHLIRLVTEALLEARREAIEECASELERLAYLTRDMNTVSWTSDGQALVKNSKVLDIVSGLMGAAKTVRALAAEGGEWG